MRALSRDEFNQRFRACTDKLASEQERSLAMLWLSRAVASGDATDADIAENLLNGWMEFAPFRDDGEARFRLTTKGRTRVDEMLLERDDIQKMFQSMGGNLVDGPKVKQ